MKLWDWAVTAYARRGVAEACLSLQDEHAQNVPFLLWAAWASPDEAVLREAVQVARRWEAHVVGPLRHVRRALKTPQPPVADGPRAVLREDVKAAELASERLLLDTLETLAPRQSGEPLASLSAAASAWGPPPPRAALERLVAALA